MAASRTALDVAVVDGKAEPPALDELIRRGRGGDRDALKWLIELYQARVANFVLAQTRDANSYEDLCQTIFVKMVLALPRLRSGASFEAWLFRIARNVIHDHQRTTRGWRRYFVGWEAEHESVADSADAASDERSQSALQQALQRLSAPDRALLTLHFEHDRKYQDLARASNSTVSAIKTRLYRVRRELRGLLQTGNPE